MAASKAKEFSQRIEEVIIGDINQILPQKLSSEQLGEVSQRLTEEMIALFASESFQHNEKASFQAEADIAPGFAKSPWFRWGVAAVALLVIGLGIKMANEQVKSQAVFTENLIEKQKEEMRFKPQMTEAYRDSYTDNVLYMDRYLEIKNNPQVQEQWALNLNEFFMRELRLSEEQMVRFIGFESALLKRLSTLRTSVDARYLEEGIVHMREAEKEDLIRISQLLQGSGNYNRLRVREKIFLSQMRAQIPVRSPAQNPAESQ
jgi:hypothetical protein